MLAYKHSFTEHSVGRMPSSEKERSGFELVCAADDR